jgi:hypothetical protein
MSFDVHVLSTPTDWWTVAAAWVQAVGSIIAIGAAIWISRVEASRVRAEKRQERIDHISLIQGVANMAYLHIRQTAQQIKEDDSALEYRGFDSTISENLSTALLRFDIEKLRSPPGAASVIGLANDCAMAPGFASAAGKLLHEQGSAIAILEDDVDEWEARALAARNDIMQMTPEF